MKNMNTLETARLFADGEKKEFLDSLHDNLFQTLKLIDVFRDVKFESD